MSPTDTNLDETQVRKQKYKKEHAWCLSLTHLLVKSLFIQQWQLMAVHA